MHGHIQTDIQTDRIPASSLLKAPDFAGKCLVFPLQGQYLARLCAEFALQLLQVLSAVHRHLVVVAKQLQKAWRFRDIQPHVTPVIKILQRFGERER